jgi:hypothetical protein
VLGDMHNRMKEALALLGRIDKAVVRPPLKRIGETEREQIRQALVKSGLMAKAPVQSKPRLIPKACERSGVRHRSN